MKKIPFLIILALVLIQISCTKNQVKPPYTVAFYNMENLFDTIDHPEKFDEEFMPNSDKNWNTNRYRKKMYDLSKVLYHIDTLKLPVVVGVCEIENKLVLSDLANEDLLKKANYKIVWEEGRDSRGIDVALLYNPAALKVISYEYLPVIDPNDDDFITREILYVKGSFGKDVFHFYVNHWPSRRGGQETSEPKRIMAAQVLRLHIDEILATDSVAKILIMGDMNDEPGNMSLSDVLMAMPNKKPFQASQLINLTYDEFIDGKGTYNYRGDWNMLDNIIVSGSVILDEKGLSTSLDDGKIFHLPFMEYVNNEGQMSPNRTYGRSYYGGISDHFPVYLTLE